MKQTIFQYLAFDNYDCKWFDYYFLNMFNNLTKQLIYTTAGLRLKFVLQKM